MRGWPRNDTDDHGRRVGGVVLVLSAAVLVIVIDARCGVDGVGACGEAHGGAEARRFDARGLTRSTQSSRRFFKSGMMRAGVATE